MMIHKITPSVDYNQWLKRLYTQLIEPTDKISIVLKVVKPMNKKTKISIPKNYIKRIIISYKNLLQKK